MSSRHDIGMTQHGNCLALRMEAAAEILIAQVIILQNFDCHHSVQPVTAGLIYNSHTADTQYFQNLVPVIQQATNILIIIISPFTAGIKPLPIRW